MRRCFRVCGFTNELVTMDFQRDQTGTPRLTIASLHQHTRTGTSSSIFDAQMRLKRNRFCLGLFAFLSFVPIDGSAYCIRTLRLLYGPVSAITNRS